MKKIKAALTVALLMLAVLVMAGCSEEVSPYQINDAENYSVSVKYDANGGYFGTNTTVIVDSYNIDEIGSNEIALISPDNEVRGEVDTYKASNPGHFLAGWYAQRTETANGYTYAEKWDFENSRLTVDPGKTYSAAEPALTLYAVWVPAFEIEFYDLATGKMMEEYAFNPTETSEIKTPAWNEETGAIDMYNFPQKDGYTFKAAYYDAEATQPVDTTVNHPGTVNEATGTAENATMKLYLDWTEGEWYRIYNAQQFVDNASVSGNYEIFADLDFEGEIWPTKLVHGNFTGSIVGNGYTFKNITVEQTDNAKVNSGLFGNLTEGAQVKDLTLENVTFTIKAGTRAEGANFGLLAGAISDKAVLENVVITSGQLIVDAGSYFGTDNYAIGLLCGMGTASIDTTNITCSTTGDGLWVSVEDGMVILSKEPVEVAVSEPTAPVEETAPEETQEA